MSIARKSVAVLGSRLTILIITMATGIVLNRLLGATGRGLYVLTTSVAFLQLQSLTSLGMQVSNQVFVAKERELQGQLHTWALLFAGLVEVGAALVVWIFWIPITHTIFHGITPLHMILITACVAPGFYWVAWQGLMIGLGEVKTIALFNLGLAIVQNGSIVILLALWKWVYPSMSRGRVIDIMIALFVGIMTLSTFVMAVLLRRHGSLWGAPRLPLFRRLLSFGGRVYVGDYASRQLSQFDQLLVNALASATALGVYNQAASLATKVWMVSAAIENSAYAPVSGSEKEEARSLTVNLFRVTLWISIGLIIVGWILSPLIPVIYGADFQPTVKPFRVLILGTAVFGCGRMFSMYFTGNRKKPQILMVLNWLLLPVNIGLCFLLIPRFGIIGASVATMSTYTFSMTTLLVLFFRDGQRLSLRRFFIPQPEDWARVRKILSRVFGRPSYEP